MKKWFIFDLDQTLLNDNHQVSEQNKKLIAEWIGNGNQIGLCSGKPLEAIEKNLTDVYELSDFVAAYNGAFVKMDDKVIEQKTHFDNLNAFRKFASDIPFTITFGKDNSLHTDEKHSCLEDIIKRNSPESVNIIPDIDDVNCHVLRLIVHSEGDLEKLTEKAKAFFKDFNVCSSTGIFVLITKKQVSKSSALKLLGNDLIYYFGDSGNDEDVFDLNQDNIITIAPKNATAAIKAKAKVVLSTDNNEGFFLKEILEKTNTKL